MKPQDPKAAATAVREYAHAPYSNFKVGAALRTASDAIFSGCNVENVAYPGKDDNTSTVAGWTEKLLTATAEVHVGPRSQIPFTLDMDYAWQYLRLLSSTLCIMRRSITPLPCARCGRAGFFGVSGLAASVGKCLRPRE